MTTSDRVSMPCVVVVVLAHNGCADSVACLDSLRSANWANRHVVFVDNGSTDGSSEVVAERFQEVHILRREENLGFAEGNNVGIRQALALGADYVLLLNNDTVVASDAIAACVAVARSRGDIGAVCPMVYFTEPPTMIWYAGARFDPQRTRSGRMLGYRELDRGQFASAGETDRAVGAAVLIPRPVLETVGVLDSQLFFLYEDVDWSLRARQAGYRIFLAPEAKVWHRVSASSGGEHSVMIAYYDTRNHLEICRRYAELTRGRSIAREAGLVLAHLAGVRRGQRRFAYVRAVLQGWRDARRGRLGPRV
jgi:GT2 family glycosyltransferase